MGIVSCLSYLGTVTLYKNVEKWIQYYNNIVSKTFGLVEIIYYTVA